MFVILFILILGVSIIIERLLYISFKNRIDSTAFVNRIIELLQRGKVNNAIELCAVSQAALPRIVRAGLEEANKSPKEIQNALELAAMIEFPKLEKRTHFLGVIANVATLMGLLGTIFGLISSFTAVAQAEASMKAQLLTAGISVAMNTTAFGIITAIPCMLSHAYIQERTTEIIDGINQNVARIYRRIVALKG
ncbi:MotA/TolQ/ExbB proton channel family protein [candidate division KSB1 bacterium]|nr:MotA/TolQ/ExbB proton channel family protein [candidate division KSB1 bacterium]